MKNALIGTGIAAALVVGGYMLSSGGSTESGYVEYDTDYTTTRDSLNSGAADMDCGDFSTRAEAQEFFDSEGPGDPHGLDRDGDGEPCETLP